MSLLVLGLDVGTTNAKAQMFDARGRGAGRPFKTKLPLGSDGTADAEAIAESVEALLDETLADSPRALGAVGMVSAWHGLVGLDAAGRPVTRLSSWLDARAGEEVLLLKRRLHDLEAIRQRTGVPLHPSLPPARLLWLARHSPREYGAAVRWAALAEFLEVRWFGPQADPSLSMASGSGLYDQFGRRWDPDLLQALELPAGTLATPIVGEAPAMPGRAGLPLLPAYARRWPALAAARWLPARGDGACAPLGSGGRSAPGGPRRAALTVGTSAAIRVLVPWRERREKPLTSALFGYLLDEERAIVGAARSNAGSLISWAREVLWLGEDLRKDGFAQDPVELATRGRPPGGHGLRAEASLGGERSPLWPADARASISGLRTDSSALDILQALLEASVLGLAQGMRELERWAGPLQVVLSGGGARSPGWHHLLADALGREIVVSSVDEASLRGAALAALEEFGWLEEEGLEPADAHTVSPDPERAGAFARLG